jgi:DNA-binding NarL/FixJ family response regulator
MTTGPGVPPQVRRVLHVEDNPQSRAWLELIVDSAPDLRVVGAAVDGLEGIELAAELNPDIIVLDQEMPTLDGLGALPLLRQVCPDARVVMWSHDPLVRERALAAGVAEFVDKASSLQDLVDALRR